VVGTNSDLLVDLRFSVPSKDVNKVFLSHLSQIHFTDLVGVLVVFNKEGFITSIKIL